MDIEKLQQMLLEAYATSNLNKISLTLINLYKTQQYQVLQKISEIIGDFITVNIKDDGKGFSKLIMLYHPDRAGYHIGEINRLAGENNFDRLLEYSHILKLERIEEIAAAMRSYEDIDYSPVYDWDMETEGFTIINDSEPIDIIKTKTNTDLVGYAFYDAIKIREFGHTDIEYPSFYLEDIEEFELSSSDIDDLDGVQFCINARIIDVSDNRITDLAPLTGLSNLAELNLSDNQIGYIDALCTLCNLKSLQISNNEIEDISPLFGLGRLEYVDLSGNRINIDQIRELSGKGVTVWSGI
jgi:Leucine-rich repeat (LRR) protein